eukprot:tig00000769_g4002.t1
MLRNDDAHLAEYSTSREIASHGPASEFGLRWGATDFRRLLGELSVFVGDDASGGRIGLLGLGPLLAAAAMELAQPADGSDGSVDSSISELCQSFLAATDEQVRRNRDKISLEHQIQQCHNSLWSFAQPFSRVEGVCGCGNRVNYVHSYQTAVYNEGTHADMVSKIRRLHDMVAGPWLGSLIKQHQQRLALTLAVAAPVKACRKLRPSQQYSVLCALFDTLMDAEAKKDIHMQRLVIYVGSQLLRLAKAGPSSRGQQAAAYARTPSRSPISLLDDSPHPSPTPPPGEAGGAGEAGSAGAGGVPVVLSGTTSGPPPPAASNVDLLLGLYAETRPAAAPAPSPAGRPADEDPLAFFSTPAGPAHGRTASVGSELSEEAAGEDPALRLSDVHAFLAARIFAHSSCAAWAAPLLQPTVEQIVKERWLHQLLERDWTSSSSLSEGDLLSCLAQVPWTGLAKMADSADLSVSVVRPLKSALEHFSPLAMAAAPMHPLRHLALTLAKFLVVTGSTQPALTPEVLDVLVHGPWPCKLMAVPLAGFTPLHSISPDTIIQFFGEMYMIGTTVEAVKEYAKKYPIQRKVHRDTFVQGIVSHNALVSEFYSLEPLLQKACHSAPYPHFVLLVLLAEHHIRASRGEEFAPAEGGGSVHEGPAGAAGKGAKRMTAVEQWGAKWRGQAAASDEWLARLVAEELFYFAMLMPGRLFASSSTASTLRSEAARWLGALCANVPSVTSVALELLVNNARDIAAEPRHLLERLPMAAWQPDPYILDKMQTLLLQRPANPQCLFVNCAPTDTPDETITHWVNLAFSGPARPSSLARAPSGPSSSSSSSSSDSKSQRDSELHVACALFHELRWERCPPAARMKALLALLGSYHVVPRTWWWAVLSGPVGASLVAGPMDRHFAEVVVSQLDRTALASGSVAQMTAYVVLCIGVAANDLAHPETLPPPAAPGKQEPSGVAWLSERRVGKYLQALARDLDHSVSTFLLSRAVSVAVKAPDEFAGVLAEAIEGCVTGGPARVVEEILRVMDDSLRNEAERERVALEWALALSHPAIEAEHGLPLLDALLQYMYYESQPLSVLSHAIGRRLGPVTKEKLIEYVEGGYLWVAYTLLVSFGPAVPSLLGTLDGFATPVRAVRQIVRTLSRSLSAKAAEKEGREAGRTPRSSPTNGERDRYVERQERVQPGGLAASFSSLVSAAVAVGAAAATATGIADRRVSLARGREEKDELRVQLPEEDGESLLGTSSATPDRVRDLVDGEPSTTPVQPRTALSSSLLCSTAMGLFRETALALGPSELALPFWEQFFVMYLEWSPAAAAAGYDTRALEEEDTEHFKEMAEVLEQHDRQLSGLYWAFTRYTSELLPGKGRFLVGGGVTLYMDKLQSRHPCRLSALRDEDQAASASQRSVDSVPRRSGRNSALPPTTSARIPNLRREMHAGRAPLLVPAPRFAREQDIEGDLDAQRAGREEGSAPAALVDLLDLGDGDGPEEKAGAGAGAGSSSSSGEATSAETEEEEAGAGRGRGPLLPVVATMRKALAHYHAQCGQLLKTDESMLLFSRQMYSNAAAWFTVSVRCLESEECSPAVLSVQESTVAHGSLHAPELTPVIDLLRSNRELYQQHLLSLLEAGQALARASLALAGAPLGGPPRPRRRPRPARRRRRGGRRRGGAVARARALFFAVLPAAAEAGLPAALRAVREALGASMRDLGARAVRGHAPSQHRLLAALLRASRRRPAAERASRGEPGTPGKSPQQPGTLPPSPSPGGHGAGPPSAPGTPMPLTASSRSVAPPAAPGTPLRGGGGAGASGSGRCWTPARCWRPPGGAREYLGMLSGLARRAGALGPAALESAARAFDADRYMDALAAEAPRLAPPPSPPSSAASAASPTAASPAAASPRPAAPSSAASPPSPSPPASPRPSPPPPRAPARGASRPPGPSGALVPLVAALTLGCPALLAALAAELQPPAPGSGPAPPRAVWPAVKRLFAAFLRPCAAEGAASRERARRGRPSPSYLLGVTAHGSGDTSGEAEGDAAGGEGEGEGAGPSERSLRSAGSASQRFLQESTLCRGLELVAKLAEKVPALVDSLYELYLDAMPPLCSAGAPVHAWSSVRQHVRGVEWGGARFHVAPGGAALRALWEALPSMDLVACELFNALPWEPLLAPDDAEPRDEALLLFLRLFFSLRLLRRRELSMRVGALVRRSLDEGASVWDRLDASRLCAYFDGTALSSIVLRGGEGIMRALATPDAGAALLEAAKTLYGIALKRGRCAQAALAAAREASALVRFSLRSANQSWIVQPAIHAENAVAGTAGPALSDLVWRVPARERLVAEVLVPLCERFAEPPHPPSDAALLVHHLLAAADPAALPEPATVAFSIPSGRRGEREERPAPPVYVRSDGTPDFAAISSDEELYAALSAAAPEPPASGSGAVAAAVQRFCAGIASAPLALEMLALIPRGVTDPRAAALLLEHTLRGFFAHAPPRGSTAPATTSSGRRRRPSPSRELRAGTPARRRPRRRAAGRRGRGRGEQRRRGGRLGLRLRLRPGWPGSQPARAPPAPPSSAPAGPAPAPRGAPGGGAAGGAGAMGAGLVWRLLMDVCRERRCCLLALVLCERQRRGMEGVGAGEWAERAVALAECISYFTADARRPFDLLFLWLWLLQLFGDGRWEVEGGSATARLVDELDAGLAELAGEAAPGAPDAALKNLVARAYLAVADSRPASNPVAEAGRQGAATAGGLINAALAQARRPMFGLQARPAPRAPPARRAGAG